MENTPNISDMENSSEVIDTENVPTTDVEETTPSTVNMESILTSIKKLIGYDEEYTHYDQDIIIFINTTIATLRQLGIGPENGFVIKDSSTTWSDYLGETLLLETVKTYIHLKVKLVFDPPSSSFVLESIKEIIKECECRLNMTAESRGEEIQNGV